jgi:hypothetical protein
MSTKTKLVATLGLALAPWLLAVPALKHRRIWGAGAAIIAATALTGLAVAAPLAMALFAVYTDESGTVLTQSSDPTTLNGTNPFFDPSIGTNEQACVTCHQPSVGLTISVDFINQAFNATKAGTGPLDPIFRTNDTANNPHASAISKNPDDYSLILNLGAVRIGKTIPAGADFTVFADTATNLKFAAPETFPLHADPQHLGTPTLSLFRRPLINTNVNFDSAVLWDGREDTSNIPLQVSRAIQTLLLGAGTNATVNNSIANFMTGVFTDQKSSDVGGQLDAAGATGGVTNLLALASSPSRPCVFDKNGDLTPFVAAVATINSCTPVVPGGVLAGGPPTFTLFESWETLPNNSGNAGRLSIARGEKVFNEHPCVFCHAVPNLGNHPSSVVVGGGVDPRSGFRAIGTDSLVILQEVQARAAPGSVEEKMMQDMIDRVSQLPLYCLRPTSSGASGPCGTDANDVKTTDPGRALVTGHIADANAPLGGGLTGGGWVQAAHLARPRGALTLLSRRCGPDHPARGQLL